MRVLNTAILVTFMKQHAQARGPLRAWLKEAREARWRQWSDIKSRYPGADLIPSERAGHRIVFNIKGRKYRLAVLVYFTQETVIIERVGTHAEYDRWKL